LAVKYQKKVIRNWSVIWMDWGWAVWKLFFGSLAELCINVCLLCQHILSLSARLLALLSNFIEILGKIGLFRMDIYLQPSEVCDW